jgi:hypothetical protein
MTKNISGKSLFFSLQYVVGHINKKGPNNELVPGGISQGLGTCSPSNYRSMVQTDQSEPSLYRWVIFLDRPFPGVI